MGNHFNLPPLESSFPPARLQHAIWDLPPLQPLPTVSRVQPPLNLSQFAHLFGPPVPTHTFDISRTFDADCSDAYNFGISDNALGVINAVLSGMCVYLLADVVFRVAARLHARTGLKSAGIFRAGLVQRVANPLYWPTFIAAWSGGNARRNPGDDMYSSADDAAAHPRGTHHASRRSRVALSVAGVLLCGAELLFIFLATNRSSVVPINKARMPAIVWTERGDESLFGGLRGCHTTPIVNKTGFQSEARMSLCDLYEFSPIVEQDEIAAGTALLIIKWTPWAVLVEVITRVTHSISYLYIHVTPMKWPEQRTRIEAPGPRTHDAVLRALGRHAIPLVPGSALLRANMSTPEAAAQGVPWEFRFVANFSGLRAPGNLAGELAWVAREDLFDPANQSFVPAEDVVWSKYLRSILFALFAPTGRAEAVSSRDLVTPLTEFDGALITKNRPWLSVVGWMVLVGGLSVAWLVVCVVCRWEAGVEYCSALTVQFINNAVCG